MYMVWTSMVELWWRTSAYLALVASTIWHDHYHKSIIIGDSTASAMHSSYSCCMSRDTLTTSVHRRIGCTHIRNGVGPVLNFALVHVLLHVQHHVSRVLCMYDWSIGKTSLFNAMHYRDGHHVRSVQLPRFININICSIEVKWDGKLTKIWYDNEMRWIRITKMEQIIPKKSWNN